MAAVLPAQSKRLSFSSDVLHRPNHLPSQETLTAFSAPSYDSYCRALEQLSAFTSQRFVKVEAAAGSRGDLSGDNNLKVVKRQYDSVKNTYMNLDIKDQYTDALLEGHPLENATERLNDAEDAIGSHAAILRANKDRVRQAEGQLAGQIGDLAKLCTKFGTAQGAAETSLQNLADLEQQAIDPLPPPGEGLDEAECRAMLASESAQAQALEASLASSEAEMSELRAAVAAEEDEVAALRAQVQAEEAMLQSRQAADHAPGMARFEEYLEWCEEHAALVSELSGVSLLSVDRDAIRLRINTIVDLSNTGAKASGIAEVDHLLLAHMDPVSGRLMEAEAVPSDMPMDRMLAQADGSLSLLVHALQAQCVTNLQAS